MLGGGVRVAPGWRGERSSDDHCAGRDGVGDRGIIVAKLVFRVRQLLFVREDINGTGRQLLPGRDSI